jgi:putative transposase
MRRAIKKVRKQLSDYVDGRHHAYTHYLCTNFQNILIPRFNVKGVIANKARFDEEGKFVKQSRLSKQTKKILLAMKHGKFRARLIMKASEYAETQVWTASEEYTTQTCGACLTMNKHVGSAKVFRCVDPDCGLVIDRDWNGARNVLLKCINARA